MEYSKDFFLKIDDSASTLNQMIQNAKQQGAKNFDMLYTLDAALNELRTRVLNKQKLERDFIIKWDNIMGWVPRVFEDHPLLDSLRSIDTVVMSFQ